MEKDKATGARTQGSWLILGRARTGKEKERPANAKVTVKVNRAEKDLEKAKAKKKDGALQPRHRPVSEKALGPTTRCVTTAGSGAAFAKAAHSQTVVKRQPDPSKRRAMRRPWHFRQRA